ncbi:LPS export ABC transporter permease LptG [Chitinimonas sp. BJB300]|uniref:LPS export ABC transporter permease LptG n=1 Tax=Chitinimonas sp. BJB300 TaxID=1559339 RepID=UPI000C1081A5|nr:LPS export ABC transporter permease LptG [Chitinimonas sp. BJB300]PHV13497.1 LPS export ABC transporter permease LptG [Chitinimonas sp. BJB300]TSJ89819.1 LPS export ABC transporter permease LptG [Chitinimonas sp. BJB300]
MKILSRYLIAEVVRTSLFVLAALLGLFLFFDLIGELGSLGKGGYSFGKLLAYVMLLAPGHAYELMPIAVLIGSLFALSMLNQNSELTVMRVGGMSVQRMLGILSIAGVGFAAFTLLAGEYIAPRAERMATQLRLAAKGQLVTQDFRSGFWMKDDGSFVNVREVLPDQTLHNINFYQFDVKRRLSLQGRAERGVWQPKDGAWLLSNITATHFENGAVKVEKLDQFVWHSVLTPDTLAVLLIAPEQMSVVTLMEYIDHLKRNQQQTRRYEIALWTKLVYPLACLAMLVIALPFSQTQRRAGGIGIKLFVGIMLGLGFYFVNKLVGHMGLLYDWPPLLAASLPSTLFLALATYLLWRQGRR